MKILNQVGSLLSSLQGNKILQKLSKKKDQGFYKNELDFKQDLKNNLIDIASVKDQPLYVPVLMTAGIAYSEIFNNNIEEILLDLEVLFEEINYLFSKIKSHEVFFERSTNDAEILIKKLEQNVESAKVEVSPDNAFNRIFHNTFIDASYKVDFTNLVAKEFYYDSIIGKRTNFDHLCDINIQQGKLSLPKFSAIQVPISEARILTTESTVSDYNISFPGNDIANITSSNFIESWNYSILTRKQLKEPAKLVVVLDFGDIKEFNSLTIKPNSNEPIYLDEIYTLDSNGTKDNLEIDKGLITEAKTILFNRRISKAVYVSFKQDTNKLISYDPSEPVSLAELQRNPTLPLTIDTISGQIKASIKDPSIKNILGLQRKNISESLLVYYYAFSLNSIQVGNDDYKNKGIYVSKPEEFKNLRNLGLYVKDIVPESKHWQTNLPMLSGSIEYSLFKKDYDATGRLIKSSVINVLPVSTPEILNERLYFDQSKIIGLRFIGHKTDGDASTVQIYRNGEPLIRGIDWKFRKRQSLDLADPMIDVTETKTIIELTQTNEQIANGVYWAKYIPRFILEPDALVVDNGVRFLENCSILTPNIINGQEIARTDVYVHIIIRNHTESSVLTPYIDYYRLAGKEE